MGDVRETSPHGSKRTSGAVPIDVPTDLASGDGIYLRVKSSSPMPQRVAGPQHQLKVRT